MTVNIMISNGKEAYIPSLKEGIQLDLERKGSPGKLKFSYFNDGNIKAEEGNQVKVVYKNTKDKTNDIFLVKSGENINKWGVLQLNESVETKEAGARKAEALLKYYNKVYKTLTVKDAFGDVRVKAGSSMVVMLQFEDVKISSYMVAEKVTHTFKNDEHLMTLKLRGGLFNV